MSTKHSPRDLAELMPMLTWASMKHGLSPRSILATVSPKWDRLANSASVIGALNRLAATKGGWTRSAAQQEDLDTITDEPVVQLAYLTMLAVDEPPAALSDAALQWQAYLQLHPELFKAPQLGDDSLLILSALIGRTASFDRHMFITLTDAVQTKLSVLLDQVKQYYYYGGEE